MKYRSTIPPVTLWLLLLAACSNQAVYTGESFAEDSPFKRRFNGDAVLACESARRSLLGQGYLIESASGEAVKGRKASRSEDVQNTFLEVNVVCLPDNTGSTLFASAQVSEYALKKSSSAASVGVSALGSISLPIGQSADSLVKVREETIDDKDFYQRFFAAVGKTLAEMQAGKVLSAPAALPAGVPEPQPAPEAAPTAVLEPLPAPPEPASPPQPLPEPAASAVTSAPAPAQEAPPADPQEPLPGKPSTLPVLEPIVAEEAPAIAPDEVTPQANPAASAAPEPVPEPVPETLPDPVIENLF